METDKGINFSNKRIILILIPLIIEQFLGVAVGMVDIIMVSGVGESAVSGISLVDVINNLLIGVFASLATGGYVLISQGLGQKNPKKSCEYSIQMFIIVIMVSTFVSVTSLAFNNQILNVMYSDVEKEVMDNAKIYFYLTALSFPFLAIQSASSAIFRSMGKTKITLFVVILMNIINVVGNSIFILRLGLGATGAGLSTLIVRVVGAVVLLVLCFNKKNEVHLTNILKWRFDFGIINKMLNISLPMTIDGAIFQVGKILLQSLIVTFGTSAIAANAVGNSIANFAYIPGSSIGVVLIMIVGQLIGAKEHEKVKIYTKKLVVWNMSILTILNVFILIFIDPILSIYNLTPEGYKIAYNLVIIHAVTSTFFWTFSFTLPNALRAANDAKYTMFISIISMWVFRVGFSYILCLHFGLGVSGVWIAMAIDWVFRGICFIFRFKSNQWMYHSISV